MAHLFRGKEPVKTQSGKNKGATQLLPETLWADEPMPSGIPPENTVAVTISRQFGSGGSDIARLVAQAGNLHYIDNHIIDEVAKRLGIDPQRAENQDEQTAGMVGHVLKAVQASSPFAVNYSTLLDPTSNKNHMREAAYFHLTQKVILELASQGNTVIVGRGSQFLLHNSPRTLHIHIFAPLPYRIDTIMRQFQLNHTMAARLIAQRDYEQDNYLQHYYGTNGHQSGLYHLLINTGLFSFELAAGFIQQALPIIKEIA